MAVIETAEKMLPAGLRPIGGRALRMLAAVLTERGEKAAAQRMALTAFTIRILSAALAFVSQIVLARLMGEYEYGIFVFVWVLVVVFGDLSCLGFHTAIIRFLPQYRAAGAVEEIRGLTGTARIFALLSGTAVLAAGMLGLHFFGDMIQVYYLVPIFLGLLAMPMIALGDILEGTSRANHWPVMALSPVYIIRPILIIAFMLIAIASGAEHTAVTAMQAALAATFVTALGQYAATLYRLRRHYDKGPHKVDFLAWFSVAFPIFLIEGVSFLLTNSDVVVVGIFLEPHDVAIYFAAAKTMALVHFINFSVKAASGPRFSSIIAEGDHAQLATAAIDAARWTFWPALGVGLAVLAAGHLLLSLFGGAFTSGYLVMAILLAGILAKSLVGPAETLLMMAGRQNICVALYAGALTANVGLNLALIPHYGIEGTAIATASAMAVEAILLHLAVRRTLGIVLFAFASPSAATPEMRVR
ncbi:MULTISPECIES: oligosaccharide flippase family protein [unclassified Rhizobium]|uniref:oligosaccharide flippase family protein n=1 Tax=unclassified Rhizobium TaxID=2613769 RepID=UPI001A9812A2|nr:MULTISPECIES: oligosaccharide flippase family protein [unclassified Rhizobium]MBX5187108.1 oligosaccharide flippase family protein [Rhizobium sp. NZLR5]MBX5193425.1 oligosaccharide flippase family protein [Rhizobium sp. NZLR3b]MBX5199586.1 oligosaccharide flippase family protein [Rhizobium sp. NZLR10]MBX5205940.1 oligosaccharide flippase family protein [Rhizobium sp. NZLR1]QSZ20603.1 oligosaccharide flippase family protein [Rhizobium sp. NZLR1]